MPNRRLTRTATLVLCALLACFLQGAHPQTAAAQEKPCGNMGTNLVVRSGEVKQCDVAVLGADVTVESGGIVNGDVLTLYGNVFVQPGGQVKGDVNVAAGNADVNGAVSGNVFASGNVTLGPTAVVTGSVDSVGELKRDPAAQVISGHVGSRTLAGLDDQPQKERTARARARNLAGALASILLAMLFAALVVAMAPASVQTVRDTASVSPWVAGLVGFLAWVLMPILMVLLIPTVIGVIVVPVLYAVAAALGFVAVSEVIGRRIVQRDSRAWRAAVGSGILALLVVLGSFGGWTGGCLAFFFWLLVASWGLGATILTLFGTRPWPRVHPAGPLPSVVEPEPGSGPAVDPSPEPGPEPAPEPVVPPPWLAPGEEPPVGDPGSPPPVESPPPMDQPAPSTAPDLPTVHMPSEAELPPAEEQPAPGADEPMAETPVDPLVLNPPPFELTPDAGTAEPASADSPPPISGPDIASAALPGMTPIYAHLLREAGLGSVASVAQATPEQLVAAVAAPGVVPVGVEMAGEWIRGAKGVLGG